MGNPDRPESKGNWLRVVVVALIGAAASTLVSCSTTEAAPQKPLPAATASVPNYEPTTATTTGTTEQAPASTTTAEQTTGETCEATDDELLDAALSPEITDNTIEDLDAWSNEAAKRIIDNFGEVGSSNHDKSEGTITIQNADGTMEIFADTKVSTGSRLSIKYVREDGCWVQINLMGTKFAVNPNILTPEDVRRMLEGWAVRFDSVEYGDSDYRSQVFVNDKGETIDTEPFVGGTGKFLNDIVEPIST